MIEQIKFMPMSKIVNRIDDFVVSKEDLELIAFQGSTDEIYKLNTNISDILCSIRKNNHIKYCDATDNLKFGSNTIRLWEQNKVTPTIDNLIKLFDFYGYELVLKKKKE